MATYNQCKSYDTNIKIRKYKPSMLFRGGGGIIAWFNWWGHHGRESMGLSSEGRVWFLHAKIQATASCVLWAVTSIWFCSIWIQGSMPYQSLYDQCPCCVQYGAHVPWMLSYEKINEFHGGKNKGEKEAIWEQWNVLLETWEDRLIYSRVFLWK